MGLELKVEQKQRVYQKQIEQARILQMNAQELAVCIQEAALENPLIELEEMMDVPIEELVKKDVRETDETEAEVSEDTDWRYTGGHQSPEDWWTPQGGKSESLVDMIHQQLLTMSIGEKEKEIVEKLAGALDSRGYLEIPVKKLAKYIPCSVQELRSALEILKSLEPAGIGATDLKECLKGTGRERGCGKRCICQNQDLEPKTGKYFRGRNNGALCDTRYYCVGRTWRIHSGIERGCVPETAAE